MLKTHIQFSSVQFSHSVVSDPLRPHELQHARPSSITNSRSSLRLTSIESVMPSSHLILCRPLLLLPPIPPSILTLYNQGWRPGPPVTSAPLWFQAGPSAGGRMRNSTFKHLCSHQVWFRYLDLSPVFLVSVPIWEIMSNQLSRLCILNSSPRNLESHLGLDLSSWTSLLTDRAPSYKPNSPPEDAATMSSIIHQA